METRILMRPYALAKLAMGNPMLRERILSDLADLTGADTATDLEVPTMVGANRLYGMGIEYIDAHLLAAVRLPRRKCPGHSIRG